LKGNILPIPIERAISFDSSGFKFVARRGSSLNGINFINKSNGFAFVRSNRDIYNTEFAFACKLSRGSGVLSFDVRRSKMCSLDGLMLHLDLISASAENSTDPFLCSNNASSKKISVDVLTCWNRVSILIDSDVNFFRAILKHTSLSESCLDFVEFKDFNFDSGDFSNGFCSFIDSNYKYQDIIFPCVRFLKKDSSPLLINFSPVNSSSWKYNGQYFFKDLDFSILFVNDVRSCWYANGVDSLSFNIDGLIKNLKYIIDLLKPEKLVTFGASMGGWGALFFGIKLSANTVIAINPELEMFREGSRTKGIIKPNVHPHSNIKYQLTSPKNDVHLFFSKHDVVDSVFMTEALYFKNKNLHVYEVDSNHVVGDALQMMKRDLLMLIEFSFLECTNTTFVNIK
jgi:hypothetical protein